MIRAEWKREQVVEETFPSLSKGLRAAKALETCPQIEGPATTTTRGRVDCVDNQKSHWDLEIKVECVPQWIESTNSKKKKKKTSFFFFPQLEKMGNNVYLDNMSLRRWTA